MTVIADASFDGKRLRAGWAVWIRSGRRVFRYSGHGPAGDSCEAELTALSNGVIAAVHDLRLGHGDIVTVQSDNQHALGVLGGSQRLREDRAADQEIHGEVMDLVRKSGIKLRTAFVRGHQGDVDVRAAIQGWCDATARAALSMAAVEDLLFQRDQSCMVMPILA
ncbi:ribonuclease HI [Azospirillum sp. OGB3]|uniref:Uncharacterized protein n=1 Tax=Azospirillum argentinense TaxID=2970906 RepID=A0A5B0KPL0_9PROT|nr:MULTISPECIES: hypothetical protein [Azospirillum]KAA1053895.1 DUF411 domain-containing protein [Azospirillum argentinense]MBB3268318.1 ribonuclease HI [Azospirillum sp. OGB3]